MMSIQTTGGSNTTGIFRSWGIAGCTLFFVAMLALNSALAAEVASTSTDDGWRRTKDGWEHISTWPADVSQQLAVSDIPPAPAPISPRAECCQRLHPGVLAAGLCLAAGFALRISRASK